RPAHLALVQRRPGYEEGHHDRLAGAGRELERVAQEVACLRHLATILHLVEVDHRLDRLLLAEEESLGRRPALFVTLKPPLQQPARDHRCVRPASLAPHAYLVPQMIDEVIHLLAGNEHVLEERGLSANDSGDATPGISRRRKETHRRTAPVLQ